MGKQDEWFEKMGRRGGEGRLEEDDAGTEDGKDGRDAQAEWRKGEWNVRKKDKGKMKDKPLISGKRKMRMHI